MTDIIVVSISSGLTLVGVIITCITSNNSIRSNIQVNQAVTETKLDQLNNTVQSLSQMNQKIPVIEERIKVINNRIADLENERKDK